MAVRNKIYFIICGIVAQLLFFGDLRADELRPRDNATEQEIATAPAHHDMTLVSSQPWVVEGEVLGTLAAYVYSDVTTERPVDYWELYDKQTNLLAASCSTDSVSRGPLSIAALWKRKTSSREFLLSS